MRSMCVPYHSSTCFLKFEEQTVRKTVTRTTFLQSSLHLLDGEDEEVLPLSVAYILLNLNEEKIIIVKIFKIDVGTLLK